MLEGYGISQTQSLSWGYGKTNEIGMKKLFLSVGIIENEDYEVKHVPVEITSTPNSLKEYFSEFLEIGLKRQNNYFDLSEISSTPIVINLMPFHLSTTFVDKFIQALADTLPTLPCGQEMFLIFLARNVDWFSKSDFLKKFGVQFKLTNPIWAIDYRGYNISFKEGVEENHPIIPRSIFYEALRLSDVQYYDLLIYGTNSYIGHFALESSHVRTHYDLYEFVRHDTVCEHLNDIFSEFIKDYDKVFIVGVGLEHSTINHLTYYFMHTNSSKVTGYVPHFERKFTDQETNKLISEADCALVITDIVNSGSTVRNIINELKRLNLSPNNIKIFSIVRMLNSPPEDIDGCVFKAALTIRREYYPNNPDECSLCIMKQPLRQVENVRDFYYVDKHQLTPLDFWEIVKDREALIKSDLDPQERRFLFRIDTMKILKKYRKWLCNVIKAKVHSEIPDCRPDCVCTVQEDPGIKFADLVTQSLNLNPNCIATIHRDILSRVTPGRLPNGINPLENFGTDILIVDDGINKGDTMLNLIQFCITAKKKILGVIVFDNRLSTNKMEILQERASCKRILCLYTWPSSPVEI